MSEFQSSREKLLHIVEEFLRENPEVKPNSLGWAATRDTRTVLRLQSGSDITTGKMDSLLTYITNYKKEV